MTRNFFLPAAITAALVIFKRFAASKVRVHFQFPILSKPAGLSSITSTSIFLRVPSVSNSTGPVRPLSLTCGQRYYVVRSHFQHSLMTYLRPTLLMKLAIVKPLSHTEDGSAHDSRLDRTCSLPSCSNAVANTITPSYINAFSNFRPISVGSAVHRNEWKNRSQTNS